MPLSSPPALGSRDASALPDWYGAWCDRVPTWVRRIHQGASERVLLSRVDGGQPIAVARNAERTLAVTAVPGARRYHDRALEAATRKAYSSLLRQLAAEGLHALRFWNFIPGLLDTAAGPGLNRYMVFNAGRAAGYEAVCLPGALPRAIATASGVGTEGDALLVGCLAGAVAGTPVENPRQVRAYQYSAKFGPRAPSFARGTVAGESLLVGGTAAIRGEECVAVGDLEGQLAETVRNLETLVEHTAEMIGCRLPRPPLECFTTMRAYVVDPADAVGVRQGLAAAGVRCPIELAVATLCRMELIVEVEGTAELGEASGVSGPTPG